MDTQIDALRQRVRFAPSAGDATLDKTLHERFGCGGTVRPYTSSEQDARSLYTRLTGREAPEQIDGRGRPEPLVIIEAGLSAFIARR